MCGINGLVLLKNVVRTEEMMTAIRFIFDEVLVATQERGHHATGLAVFKREASENSALYDFYKAPVDAKMLTTYDSSYEDIMGNIDKNTGSIISHTRWFTKGKPNNNLNNHPFDIGNVIGVHNGTISNDDYLFKTNTDNFTRIAEVDSEIIYQLINFHNKDKITYEGLKVALEDSMLRGMFALAFSHKNQPNLVHIVKQERPMDFMMWEEAGVVIFNSQKSFILDAFDKLARVGKRFGITVPATLKEYKLESDSYITLDANAESFDTVFSKPQSMLLLSSAVKTTYNDNNWYNRGINTNVKNGVKITASDSVGRMIEGELDTISGEVIIFASTQMNTVGEDDDGSGLGDEDGFIFCIECEAELQEHEVKASYNEGAHQTETYYCGSCHQEALTSVFPSHQDLPY